MALGAIQAIEAAGLKTGEDTVIVSIDAAKGEFNAMIEGKMNCAVEHTPNFGETLMETAKKIVAGEEVPATIELEEGIFPADIAEQEMPNRTYCPAFANRSLIPRAGDVLPARGLFCPGSPGPPAGCQARRIQDKGSDDLWQKKPC